MADITKKVSLDVDSKGIDEITSKFQNINNAYHQMVDNAKVMGKEEDKWINKTLKMYDKKDAALRKTIENNKKLYKQLKQNEREERLKNFQKEHPKLHKASQALEKEANKILGLFTSIWSGIVNNMKEMISEKGVASYNMGTSLFTNSSARQMSMRYGLGAGQTYALDQTMKMLNMQSDEDLMYMNTAQKEKFNELMTKYSAWYDEMEASGFLQNVQEAQLELKMFKQEVAMKFMNWFAQNKDTIMTVVNGTLKVLEGIANTVFAVLKFMNIDTEASSSSALSSEELNNATTNNNMSINNTVNANVTTNSQADAQNFGRDVAEGSIRLYNQALNTL